MLKTVLIAAFILVFLYGGAVNVSHAVRYRTPPVTTLKETSTGLLPTFVTLENISFDTDHLLKLEYGRDVLFAPVRAKDASPQSEYPIVVQMNAAELTAAIRSKSPNALKDLAALAARTSVTGRVCRVDARQLDSLRKELPLISKQVVLIDEGATPGKIQGIVMLVIGLGVAAIALAGGFKQVSSEPASMPSKE